VLAGGRVVGSGHEMDVEEVVKIAAAAIAAPAAAPSPR
jgi:hypothetical protein